MMERLNHTQALRSLLLDYNHSVNYVNDKHYKLEISFIPRKGLEGAIDVYVKTNDDFFTYIVKESIETTFEELVDKVSHSILMLIFKKGVEEFVKDIKSKLATTPV